MEINKEMNDFLQEYFAERQATGDDSNGDGKKDEGLNKVIQKMFVRHQVMKFDSIKPLLEDDEDASKLYDALVQKEGRETANEIFLAAIKEAKDLIGSQFDLAPRRKKSFELLAEQLDEKYGEGAIGENINRVIKKGGNSADSYDCGPGGCSSC